MSNKNQNDEMVSLFPRFEVRRCPFCGGTPILVGRLGLGEGYGLGNETTLHVMCVDCGSRTEAVEKVSQAECVSELIALWNGERQQ